MLDANEIWKPVPETNGVYMASNRGRIRRDGGAPTFGSLNGKGYRQFNIQKKGKSRVITVHRAVAAAFIGESNLTVDHLNGDRSDNRLENLEYVTNRENVVRGKKSSKSKKTLPLGAYKNGSSFKSSIFIDGKAYHLGTYKTPEDAHKAYCMALKMYEAGKSCSFDSKHFMKTIREVA